MKVKVSRGYYEHGGSASVKEYFAEFKGGKWVVTSDRVVVIL